MQVCVVGSGAREHALALALARTADVVVAPGLFAMPGRSREGFAITTTEAKATEIAADLFVIGPETPLVAGLADELRALGRLVLGPSEEAAALEGSKVFMKEVVERARVPSAAFACVDTLEEARAFFSTLGDGPYVIKTDGLASGKGVLVTESLGEALSDVEAKLSGRAFGTAGQRVVLEEAMSGPELSLLVLTDGTRAVPLPIAQDHKRLCDGDEGPNTGGMGAYSPVPFGTDALVDEVMDTMIEPTLAELRRRAITYNGVLYAGLMVTRDGPRLVEFNVRLGDPEAQVVLARVEGDVTGLFARAAEGRVHDLEGVSGDSALCVVLAAKGYPSAPVLGASLRGLDRAGTVEGVTLLHGATAPDDSGELVAAGGRVLNVLGRGDTLQLAASRAYAAIGEIELEGGQYRRDIGAAALTSGAHES